MTVAAGSIEHVRTSDAVSMRRNGRSFWFASLFLPREIVDDVKQLYAFCRVMDDLADESGDPHAAAHLEQVRYDLRQGSSRDPHVANLLRLAERYHLQLEVADHLIASFFADASSRMAIDTEAQLVRYCFGVAGTVGLLMAPILGATTIESRSFAADLGIALQLTNIARDVAEDARKGRRYLPGDWIGGMTAVEIAGCKTALANSVVAKGIDRLLALADCFYARAREGFPLIPRRSRTAIKVAAAVYREIGMRLRSRGLRWNHERSVVPAARKMQLACMVFAGASSIKRLRAVQMSAEALSALDGLPGLR